MGSLAAVDPTGTPNAQGPCSSPARGLEQQLKQQGREEAELQLHFTLHQASCRCLC